jgi:hypothetical protein
MLNIFIETVGDVAVVQSDGRVVRSEAGDRLRDSIKQKVHSCVL